MNTPAQKQPSSGDLLRVLLAATHDVLMIQNCGRMLNERYLHHFMSHRMQQEMALLNLHGATSELTLHPEWPTWKKGTGIRCGQYRGTKKNGGKRYYPVTLPKSGAGFIDFAMGCYDQPFVGIELTLKESWGHEEIVYDLVKLLDERNRCFKAVISCNILLRHKGLSEGSNKQRLQSRMCEAYDEAIARLGDLACTGDRRRIFLVTEVAENGRRHWYRDEESGDCLASDQLPPVLNQYATQGNGVVSRK